MIKRFVILQLLVLTGLVSSCNFLESVNPLDPAEICGGISLSDLGLRIGNLKLSGSSLEADGIHFDLNTTFQNCIGKGFDPGLVNLTAYSNLSQNSYTAPSIAKLERNQSSQDFLLGNYTYQVAAPASSTLEFNYNIEGQTKVLSTNLNLLPLKPSFSVEMADVIIGDGDAFSNQDSSLDPGESLSFKLKVTNLSQTLITTVSTNISTFSAITNLAGTVQSIGTLNASSSLKASSSTDFRVPTNMARGTVVNLTVLLTDVHSNQWTKVISVTINPFTPPPPKTHILNIGSDWEFAGFSASSTQLYLMLLEDLGNDVEYYRFYRKAPGASKWLHVCSRLREEEWNNLAVDSTKFYVGQNSGIKRLNSSDCSDVDSITPTSISGSTYFGTSYSRFSLSIDGDQLYYRRSSGDLSVRNMSTSGDTPLSTTQSLNGVDLHPYYTQFSVSDGYKWAHDVYYLWRLDTSDQALGWMKMPTSSYPDLDSVKAMASMGQNLFLATERVDGIIRIYAATAASQTSATVNFNFNEQVGSLGGNGFTGCGVGQIVTSAQGCLSLAQIQATTLNNKQTLAGFTTDLSTQYMMLEEDLSNGVMYYRFFQKEPGAGNWNFICNRLKEATWANITADANSFYVGESGKIRQLNKQTCANENSLIVTSLSSNSNSFDSGYGRFSLSVDGNLLYYQNATSDLSYRNLTLSSHTSISTQQSLGSYTLSPFYGQYFVRAGTKWAFDSNSNQRLWKLNSSDEAMGWVRLPSSTYQDLNYQKALSVIDDNVYVATVLNGVMKVFTFNATNFEASNSNTTTVIALTSTVNAVRACDTNKYRTSSQGCVDIPLITTLPIPAGETFAGFSNDGTYLYLATKQNTTFRIYKKLPANPNWSVACTKTDANLKNNLGVDGSFLYIGQIGSIRKLNKSDCSDSATLTPGSLSSYSSSFNTNYARFSLSIDGGILHYQYSGGNLGLFTLADSTSSTSMMGLSHGEAFLSPIYSQYTVLNGSRWAVDTSSGARLWLISSGNTPVGWVKLPVSTYSDLSYQKGITALGSKVYLATEQTTGTVKIFELDVTSY